jgi:cell filamentation protein, protein adenylyltransferase
LDGAIALVPDPDQFVFMYVRREAVLSSQIEGTYASLMDILEYEALIEQGEARVDVKEIVNYIAAMEYGLKRLETLPLGRRLMCEVHEILMKGVRGGEPQKTPGEFRRSQNWIGGASPATARFVPPPPEKVGDCFSDLERFLHDESNIPLPPLIKVGLAHAQFETIHPFLDGNGRTGRLLITFWLVERKILSKPLLYPSLFFKENRGAYVDGLQEIRDKGDWENWLAFFLDGMRQVAEEATARALDIVKLRENDRRRINQHLGRRARVGLALLDNLFTLPVVQLKGIEKILQVTTPTASALAKRLSDLGILEEVTGKERNRVFVYRAYMNLFPGSYARS